ncbi:MAG: hypothetical protein HZA46_12695 [Planctomycetales bacterium]|nr:hypothetical protein [Planctomycetales bacterium]
MSHFRRLTLVFFIFLPRESVAEESALVRKAVSAIQPAGEAVLLYAHPFARFRDIRLDRQEQWQNLGIKVVFSIRYESERGKRYSLEVVARIKKDATLDGFEWGKDTGPFPPGLAVGLVAYLAEYRPGELREPSIRSLTNPSNTARQSQGRPRYQIPFQEFQQARADYASVLFHEPIMVLEWKHRTKNGRHRAVQILSLSPAQDQSRFYPRGYTAGIARNCCLLLNEYTRDGGPVTSIHMFLGSYRIADNGDVFEGNMDTPVFFWLTDHYQFDSQANRWSRDPTFSTTRLRLVCPNTCDAKAVLKGREIITFSTIGFSDISGAKMVSVSGFEAFRVDRDGEPINRDLASLGWLSKEYTSPYKIVELPPSQLAVKFTWQMPDQLPPPCRQFMELEFRNDQIAPLIASSGQVSSTNATPSRLRVDEASGVGQVTVRNATGRTIQILSPGWVDAEGQSHREETWRWTIAPGKSILLSLKNGNALLAKSISITVEGPTGSRRRTFQRDTKDIRIVIEEKDLLSPQAK